MNKEQAKQHYHNLLDEAFDLCKEGEFIPAKFTQLCMEELACFCKAVRTKDHQLISISDLSFHGINY